MARIAGDIAVLELPADVRLTPGTYDQIIALTQRCEVLSIFSVLPLKFSVLPLKSRQMHCNPLVSLLQHIGTRSSTTIRHGGQPLKKRPSL